MRQLLLSTWLICQIFVRLSAQSGCPGCQLALPPGLPDDTLFLQVLPDGQQGQSYNHDLSFRVPKTTTPVHAIDTTTPPGLPISKIEIVSIQGLPPGLFWQANQTVFETATLTDGCIKICGTPTQPDSFTMTVNLKATVFIFSQEASFPMYLYIAPKISVTDGFSMSNPSGCGEVTVEFTNKIPSGGNPGITYEWDFGDGSTSTAENPPPHTYNQPGNYAVNYHATIDTAGFRLVSATVLSVGCTDLFSAGPDIYLFIRNPNSAEIFNSSPDIPNVTLPYTFPIGLKLDAQGNYTLEVWDEDSGLEGSDDPCGSISFNILSGDTLVSGDFKIVLNIEHPIEEVFSKDTVTVFPSPIKPVVHANTFTACGGSGSIVLESSYGAGNQWWLNGQPIFDSSDFLYAPSVGGYYQVQVLTGNGCNTISDSVLVEFYALPAVPAWVNDRNNLEVTDTLAVPANYSLQWYHFAAPIPGATGFTYCAMQSGEYTLVVTDLETGCTSSFKNTITYDPNYDCTVAATEITGNRLNIYPNPANNTVHIRTGEMLPDTGDLMVRDLAGRTVYHEQVASGMDQIELNTGMLAQGSYLIDLIAGNRRYLGRLIIIR